MSLSAAIQGAFGQAAQGDVGGARSRLATLDVRSSESRRDQLLALLSIHDLWLSPLPRLGDAVELQHDACLNELKALLERQVVIDLDHGARALPVDHHAPPAEAMRRLASTDLVPPLYRWLADEATRDQLEHYLAVEGGPDGGFDDLVALCQVGISGRAKVELGRNYWDEMGRGEFGDVHTNLHDLMVTALDLALPTREQMPVEGLARIALGSFLATSRSWQPEMIGALGFIELQAGPRSRQVASGLRRVGAPEAALPFYDEHATADPRHGKAWLDEVVTPLAREQSSWGPRMVRGARWRAAVNRAFFDWAARHFAIGRIGSETAVLAGVGP